MRHLILILAFLFLVSAPAGASPPWNGAGWYQVAWSRNAGPEHNESWWEYHAGPFTSEADCKATIPADDQNYMYVCRYDDKDVGGDDF